MKLGVGKKIYECSIEDCGTRSINILDFALSCPATRGPHKCCLCDRHRQQFHNGDGKALVGEKFINCYACGDAFEIIKTAK